MWIDSLFKAIGEFFGFARQERDPETVRLNRIRELDKEIRNERKKLDELLAEDNPDSVIVGNLINRVVRLRTEKDRLKK